MAPVVTRNIAPTIGRVFAFVIFYVICTAAASEFLLRPLMWLVTSVGLNIRVDMYLELASALAATVIMLRTIDHRSWSAVGMARVNAEPRALLSGVLVGGGAISITCGALIVTGLLQFASASAETSWFAAAVRVTIVLVPAALAEEVIFRGYLLTVVSDSVGMKAAVVLTSVLFGMLHLANPGATIESLSVVMLSGLLLASVRVMMNSLYAAWMAHLAWNWVMAVPVHAAVSGLRFEAPVYVASSTGPTWLSGGSWGPEGGAVAALGMLSGLVYLYARRRREES